MPKMPRNKTAEIFVLGSMFLKVDCIPKVMEVISPEDMHIENNQHICKALFTLGKDADPVTVDNWLKANGHKIPIAYLGEIINAVDTSAGVQHYCSIVKELANRRALINTCMDTVKKAENENKDYKSLLENHHLELMNYQPEVKQDVIDSRVLLKTTLKSIELAHDKTKRLTGISSGFADVDWHTFGWQPGELIILAGRPGHGKSVLCKDFAERAGVPTLYFTLEMSAEENQKRQISGQSGVSFRKIRGAKMDDNDWEMIMAGVDKVNQFPIYYVDTGTVTVQDLIARIGKEKEKHGIQLVVIDYLQLMKKSGKLSNREREVADISRALKSAARDNKVPIICLAQVNRQCENRDKFNKRPILSDLRESGAIEADADTVMFLYWESQYFKDKEEGRVELIFAKGRNIKLGTMELYFDSAHQIFRNYR